MKIEDWNAWLKEIQETLKRASDKLDMTNRNLSTLGHRRISSADITGKPVNFFTGLDDAELLKAATEFLITGGEK